MAPKNGAMIYLYGLLCCVRLVPWKGKKNKLIDRRKAYASIWANNLEISSKLAEKYPSKKFKPILGVVKQRFS